MMNRRNLLQAAAGAALTLTLPRIASADVADERVGFYTREWETTYPVNVAVYLNAYAVEMASVGAAIEQYAITTEDFTETLREDMDAMTFDWEMLDLTDDGLIYHGKVNHRDYKAQYAAIACREGAFVYILEMFGFADQTFDLNKIYGKLFNPEREYDDVLPVTEEVPNNLKLLRESMNRQPK